MRTALLTALMAVLVMFAVPLTAQTMQGNYCAPEFSSCGGNDGGDDTTGGGGDTTGGGNTEYEKVYGGDFSSCAASGNQSCLRCTYVYKLKEYACTGGGYSGYCQCIEKYSGTTLKSCTASGSCDYF